MAEQLQQMEQHVARASIVDIHKRNAIRNAIVCGYYVIDPVSIAEKFLKFETDLYR
jgi:anti-sigma28 factor (negative regulator of flagellin synthesis)